jgi:hypothetical protein
MVSLLRYASEAVVGDGLQLHIAIAAAESGAVRKGACAKTALAIGLKLDADVPNQIKARLKAGKVNHGLLNTRNTSWPG